MEESNKRKIKGIMNKKVRYYGSILAMAVTVLASKPDIAKAEETRIETETKDEKNDLEKYFDCDIPMNTNYKITAESDIYKALEFYESGTAPSNGYYKIEKDPLGFLVIGNGMTLKYQEGILSKLSQYGNNNTEILNTITDLIDSGETVLLPESIVQEETINEIQRCRDNAINAAEEYGINLSEAQINTLTELNYRYGKGNSKKLFKFLSNGGKLREFSISANRTMSEKNWDKEYNTISKQADIDTYSRENGKVKFTINIRPFNGLGMDATLENLENINLEEAISNAQNDYLSGDKRRFFARQIAMEYDEYFSNDYFICLDKTGSCEIISTGEEVNIVEYIKQMMENEKLEDKNNENRVNGIIDFEDDIDDNNYYEDEEKGESKNLPAVTTKNNKFKSALKTVRNVFAGLFPFVGAAFIYKNKKEKLERKKREIGRQKRSENADKERQEEENLLFGFEARKNPRLVGKSTQFREKYTVKPISSNENNRNNLPKRMPTRNGTHGER